MAILIKRYANRKLYNTESSRYITLKGISELVHVGKEIRVVDNETGNDITSVVLSQILVDDQKQTSSPSQPVPGRLLSEIIQRGGDALYDALRRGVDDAQDNLSELRENVRRWIQPQHSASTDSSGDRDPSLSEISRVVHESVERVLRLIDLPTRSDLEALSKHLERLASALEGFEARLQSLESEQR
ncbi:MAG: polyhydroxyalkanoate synthesis regulator DNA-binding domain-containing protein [Myxococcota bacterium]